MIYFDYAYFKCPICAEKIIVSKITGQEFHSRLGSQTPFQCPSCNKRIIFSTTPIKYFNAGCIVLIFILLPLSFLAMSNKTISTTMLTIIGIPAICLIIIGLLSQKLVPCYE
jgi:predicted RNA-binding Zn-ribbon protein involved in translation (DUF1610 family)